MSSRGRNGSDSRHYFDWLEFASADLAAAKVLLGVDYCTNPAAFHCQQSIEKALKGYLLYKGMHNIDGHNLTWLCKQAMRYDQKFRDWLDESAQLNHYYIETRYPSDIPLNLDSKVIERLYKMASDMYDFICLEVYETVNESID